MGTKQLGEPSAFRELKFEIIWQKKETIMLASFFKAQFKRPYFDDEHSDIWFKALGVIVWKLSPYLCNTLAVITIP